MMRYRSQSDMTAGPASPTQNIWQNCSQTAWTTTGSRSSWSLGTLKTMEDKVTPNFQVRRRRGEVFMNPLVLAYETREAESGAGATITKVGTPSFYCSGVPKYWGTRETGVYPFHYHAAVALGLTVPDSSSNGSVPNVLPNILVGNDVSDLLIEVSTKVHSQRGRSKTNLWETVAEIDKSLSLVSNLATTLARRIEHVRQSRNRFMRYYRGGKYIFVSAADVWLSMRYGAMPIIRDIGEVMVQLNSVRDKFVRETSRSEGQLDPFFEVKTGSQVNSSATFHFQSERREELEIRAMSYDEFYALTASRVGFSWKGFQTLGYELIPLSFVLDWFANVGDYIGALGPSYGYTQKGSCWVARRKQSLTIRPTGATAGAGYSCTSFGGSYTYTRLTTSRFPGLPLPGLVINQNFRLTEVKRATDAVALVIQRLRQDLFLTK